MSFLFDLQQSIERQLKNKYFYFSKRHSWEDNLFIAIVSTGRTGTKFLASFLSQYSPELLALHEPARHSTLQLAVRFIKRKASVNKVGRRLMQDRYEIQHLLFKENKKFYVESQGVLCLLIDPIRHIFPNYKIIHIIRDPKEVVRSFCSRTRFVNGQKIQIYAHDKFWPILPKDINDSKIAQQWPDMSLIEKGAWMWRLKNQYALDHIKEDPNAMTMRFEDIFDPKNSVQALKEMINFIGCEVTIDLLNEQLISSILGKKNATNTFLIPTFEKWPAKDKEGFLKITHPLQQKFNY